MSEKSNESIQILAVRLDGDESVFGIAEVIFRDDGTGALGAAPINEFAELVAQNPVTRVYVRDYIGEDSAVHAFREGDARFIRTRQDISKRDALLKLPRFITPSTSKGKSDDGPDGAKPFFWWELFFPFR